MATGHDARGGVQSLNRAFDLVEIVAERGGHLSIGEIAGISGLALPTIHRLLKTMVERGYMRQLPNRRYALGFRFVPLGASSARLVGLDAGPVLDELVRDLGESANVAVLSGDHAEYVAQRSSHHATRTFTEVGRRVALHCTGVGKAMLSELAPDEVLDIVRRTGLPAQTPHTRTTEESLLADLAGIRERGYALDDEEQELGTRCVAVPLQPTGAGAWFAVSVSGPLTRMTDALVARAVPLLQTAAEQLSAVSPNDPEGVAV